MHIDRESEEGTGTLVEYKGTYSQYLAAREARRGAQPRSWPTPDARDRPAQGAGRRDARPDGQAGPGRQEPRRRRAHGSRPRGSRARRSGARSRCASPSRRTAGRTVLTATELWKSFGALDVFADVSFDVGRGERLLVMGLNGAGKTTLLKVLADAAQPRPRRGRARAPTSRSGYYAQEHEGIVAGPHAARAHARGVARRRRRAAQPARDVRAQRREGVPGRRHALGRREDQARARAARRRASQPAAARRADQQPRPRRRAPPPARRSPRGRAR